MYDFIPWLSLIYVYHAIFIDIVCGNISCDVADEKCDNDVCKCGTRNSCAGNPSGDYCDATNNVCKCAENINSCPQGQI